MKDITANLQSAAKKILEENKVDLVIGFKKGSIPLHNSPAFIHNAAESENLIWDYDCENNLATYLHEKKDKKVGIVVKGCDSRSIAALIKENQINRDNLYIIGVPCTGMIDRKKVKRIIGDRELIEAEQDGDTLTLKGRDFTENVKINEVLHRSCARCAYNNPVIYDELAGDLVTENNTPDYSDIEEFEKKPASERRQYLARELSKCIRCYACRNACPMCYCEQCFIDSNNPVWIGKSAANIEDNMLFQAVRVFHLAGRCTDCGACERACPMEIDLSTLTRKMVKDTGELFGAYAGTDLESKPALSTYDINDPQPFLIKE